MQQRRVHAQPTVLCEEQKESSAEVTETLGDVVVNTECVSRRVVSPAGVLCASLHDYAKGTPAVKRFKMAWSPEQYTKFEDERNRPVRDLLAQIPGLDAVSHVVDLGCGPGNSTQLLAEACKVATVEGIDSSAEMIDAARLRLPTCQFAVQDITVWARTDGFRDLIFSNAALQWVPDHQTLISALFGKLAKCGTLAVQIPDNLNEPSHQLMRAVASRDCWRDRLGGAGRTLDGRREAAWYYRTLSGLSAKVNMWRTTYYHPLQGGSAAVVELFKGTALNPYLELLDTKEQLSFLHDFEKAIEQAYPALLDGTVLLPFPRLFFVAQAP